ncbi:coiled-coil domain-containing protein [Anaeromicrobium sediminis]|uniref:Uncharacterized protein n=1 Tax=Anaeromicrobium sediminis TaxID=1478221 RepID=A0A267MP54_9FIRM|nr:hypothetical protein [Anaeromicrobium sediminis]PAB61316.1 hypothetical protein CCE28_02470 [Anaeromicrobium sediminis]
MSARRFTYNNRDYVNDYVAYYDARRKAHENAMKGEAVVEKRKYSSVTRGTKATLSKRVSYVKKCADQWLDIEQDKIDREKDILEEAYDNVKDALDKELDKNEENRRKIVKGYKDSFNKEIDLLKDKKREKLDLLNDEKNEAIDALREEEREELDSLDRRMDKVRDYYDEKIEYIEESAAKEIKILNDQIKALRGEQTQENNDLFFSSKKKELKELQKQYNKYSKASTKEAQEKAKELQKEILDIQKEIADKEKEIEIGKLQDKIDSIEEKANKEKESLEDEKKSKLDKLEDERKEVKRQYDKELKDLKAKYKKEIKETEIHYESLIKEKELLRNKLVKLSNEVFDNQKKSLEKRLSNLEEYYKKEKEKLDQQEYVIREHHKQMEAAAEQFGKNYKNIMTKSQDQVINMLQGKQNTYYKSGKTLMQEFIQGIESKKRDLERTMGQMMSIVSDYSELHSPAKKGPLSKLDKFLQPFSKTLLKGLDTKSIKDTLNNVLSLDSSSISGMAHSIKGTQPLVLNMNVGGTWVVDTPQRKQEVVGELTNEVKEMLRRKGVK